MKCHTPFRVKPKAYPHDIDVPCGKCPPCLKRRVDGWVFRLLEEDKVATSSHFITLTYAPEHVPISSHGYMTLSPKDLTNFWKRLRLRVSRFDPNLNVRYYACGEYGDARFRPHYHAIVFNVPYEVMYQDAWTLNDQLLGNVVVGTVTGDSIAYTCKYMNKPLDTRYFPRDDRVRPFSRMSKGLGNSYLSDEIVRYHKNHLKQLYLVKRGGFRIAMPRYYRDKIFSDYEKSRQLQLVISAMEDWEASIRLEAARQNTTFEELIEQRNYNEKIVFDRNIKSRKRDV